MISYGFPSFRIPIRSKHHVMRASGCLKEVHMYGLVPAQRSPVVPSYYRGLYCAGTRPYMCTSYIFRKSANTPRKYREYAGAVIFPLQSRYVDHTGERFRRCIHCNKDMASRASNLEMGSMRNGCQSTSKGYHSCQWQPRPTSKSMTKRFG